MLEPSLTAVSVLAGLWNVLHERFTSIRRALCVFILGSTFCYGTAILAKWYGLGSEAAAVVGYLAGITSSTIYNVFVQCLLKIPTLLEKYLTKRK